MTDPGRGQRANRGPGAFGPHRVLEELGEGALSTVYKAVQEPLGRVVAVKALKETIAPTSPFAHQLEREARVLAQLGHPNVVLLFDFVRTPTQMYLVLEHIEGWSLSTVLAKRARYSPEFTAAVGIELSRGLAHAHDRGIVHRDVKPANVLMSRRGEVKIVDFGIAQRDRLPSADEPLPTPTPQGAGVFGTPAYMSPEQILGEQVDARSDIFSLGVVLYQVLAGARPFDRDGDLSVRAAAQRIRRDPPRPLRELLPEVPRPLERIVMRCLEKAPSDRFGTADEVAERLDDFFRAQSREKRSTVLQRSLVAAGLLPGYGGSTEFRLSEERQAPLGPAMLGLASVSLAFALGAFAIQWSAWGKREAAQAGSHPLELTPTQGGALRVVATPWAEVAVDGQHLDTTPFARAIPLAAGTHFVTFTHPNAPPEKREVVVDPGDTVRLDVSMNVGNLGGAGAVSAPSVGDAGGPEGDRDAGSERVHEREGGT